MSTDLELTSLIGFLRNRAEDARRLKCGQPVHVSDYARHARLFDRAADILSRRLVADMKAAIKESEQP